MSSEPVHAYIAACNREHAECAQELVDALNNNTKAAQLGQRAVPLNDIDICCIAEAVCALDTGCSLKVLNLEENSFGLQGVQALMEALESNPGHIKELRLGKNNLKDQAAVAIGHTLSRNGCGLKVLDLSENGITKLGVIPIAAALQHEISDVVELSFHNNKIEGDAAPFLSQVIQGSPKLKHLHLGYNALRDSGVSQLAKILPQAKCLSTLDLTANRIGHEGGMAIAKALMSSDCTIQRLNLRHNLLDSDAIVAFADVLRENHSLIQLFLGFMNPTPDAAASVLEAVKNNRTLLLLDIYGWKLNPHAIEPLIRAVQEGTGAIAAIVTDACQPIAASINEGNIARESRDMHPIYVGPDDRDAYLATKSLRRYSRAQSTRQSRMSSERVSRARSDNEHSHGSRPSSRHGSRRHSRRHSRRSSHDAPEGADTADAKKRRVRKDSETGELIPVPRRHSSSRRHSTSRRHSSSRRHHSPRDGAPPEGSAAPVSPPKPAPRSASQPVRDVASEDPDHRHKTEQLLEKLKETPCDPATAEAIKAIVKAIQSQIRHQHAQHKRDVLEINARLEALEARRECHCSGAPASGSGNRGSSGNHFYNEDSNAVGYGGHSAGFIRASNSSAGGGYYGGGSNHHNTDSFGRHQQALGSQYRSASRISEGGVMERAMTPLVHPSSEIRDILPDLPRPNDESGERKPEEASLQRSVNVQTFPPRIEPSPAQDADPPRRKSVAHNY